MENPDEITIPDTVNAVFKTKDSFERAYNELISRNYKSDEITVLLTGGIIPALVGSGVPKHPAEHYDKSLKEGGIIISFRPKTVGDRIDVITAWNSYGGRQIHED